VIGDGAAADSVDDEALLHVNGMHRARHPLYPEFPIDVYLSGNMCFILDSLNLQITVSDWLLGIKRWA
jgi:hypothetical protein